MQSLCNLFYTKFVKISERKGPEFLFVIIKSVRADGGVVVLYVGIHYPTI